MRERLQLSVSREKKLQLYFSVLLPLMESGKLMVPVRGMTGLTDSERCPPRGGWLKLRAGGESRCVDNKVISQLKVRSTD